MKQIKKTSAMAGVLNLLTQSKQINLLPQVATMEGYRETTETTTDFFDKTKVFLKNKAAKALKQVFFGIIYTCKCEFQ